MWILPFLRLGDYHVCSERGLVGEQTDGGMSRFVTVPANTAFRAPDRLDAELAALAEPIACSVHGYDRVRLRGHETLFIVGAGRIGLTAILAARVNGAKTIVLARHPHQRQAARRLGADEVIGEDDARIERMKELKNAQAVDLAVESVGGCGDTLVQAQRMVRPKAACSFWGVHHSRGDDQPAATGAS